MSEKIHKFNRYTVTEKEIGGGWIWLSIKYTAKKATPSWRELQTIKNNIVGENRQAIEIYPAEDQIIDTQNNYHLWVTPPNKKNKIKNKTQPKQIKKTINKTPKSEKNRKLWVEN